MNVAKILVSRVILPDGRNNDVSQSLTVVVIRYAGRVDAWRLLGSDQRVVLDQRRYAAIPSSRYAGRPILEHALTATRAKDYG